MSEILNYEPKSVWNFFHEITKIPRPSKKEDKISDYIENLAKSHNFQIRKDKVGNLVIFKPATKGMEDRKGICIQAHMDMVCEKNRGVVFDFDNDSIKTYVDGDWLKADGTTLGADNGVGLAMGLAVIFQEGIEHPDMEILCTVDEETGLTGAAELSTDILKSSEILINLDTEEDGHFTIGCAGGLQLTASYPYSSTEIPANHEAKNIALKGLKGGHSGIEINDERANAGKLLARILIDASEKFNIRLNSFDSGDKHNAIPREAYSTILVPKEKSNEFTIFINEYKDILKNEWHSKEANLNLELNQTETPDKIMSKGMQEDILNALNAVPHGVIRNSPDIKGLVQTSMNFARASTFVDTFEVLTSQRSSVESEKYALSNSVKSLFELANFEVIFENSYPAWQPDTESDILNIATNLYEKMYGKKPIIEVIHAGLECGLIGEKYPNFDMLSFGPTLKEVHTPNEMVQISTVDSCWELLLEIIKNSPKK